MSAISGARCWVRTRRRCSGWLPSNRSPRSCKGGDPVQCLAAQAGLGLLVHIPELAPGMRHAGGLDDLTAPIDPRESGIAIGLQDALEAAQMLLWMCSLPVRRVTVEHRRRVAAAVWPSIADVGPQSAPSRAAQTRFQHRHLGIVAVHPLTGHDIADNASISGRTSPAIWPTMSASVERLQVDVFAGVDLGLAMQRQMVAIFRHQHMRQQTRIRRDRGGPAGWEPAPGQSSRTTGRTASDGHGG